MACDVGQYLPNDDRPADEVERLVHLPKKTIPTRSQRRRGRGSAFVPKSRLVMLIVTSEWQNLSLVAYGTKWGDLVVELHKGDEKLRSFHTHEGHHNPGHAEVMDDGHMHFPTAKYPLIRNRSEYAYEVDCPPMHRLTDIAQFVGALLNIDIDSLQLHLDSGGRRG